jgi:hypothetical protein
MDQSQSINPQIIDALKEIAHENSNNDAIVLVIVVILGLFLVAIPFYILYTKREKVRNQQYNDREALLLSVIRDNAQSNIKVAESSSKVAEAIANLKATLDENNRQCDVCKTDQLGLLNSVMHKEDTANLLLTEIKTKLEIGREQNGISNQS